MINSTQSRSDDKKKIPATRNRLAVYLLFPVFLLIFPNFITLQELGNDISRTVRGIIPDLRAHISSITENSAKFQKTGSGELQISLSDPSRPGSITLNMVRGSLIVKGHEGNDVIIRYHGASILEEEEEEEEEKEKEVQEESLQELRKISGTSPDFDVVENNNAIQIRSISLLQSIHFEILVPENFSLKASLVTGDSLWVHGIYGDIELNTVKSHLRLTDAGGAAVVNTIDGDITAQFIRTAKDKPMAFSTISGNIDVLYPQDTPFTARLRSEFGDLYTDFDIEAQQQPAPVIEGSATGSIRYHVPKWITADINGGGPEYRFQSLSGKIILRKGR